MSTSRWGHGRDGAGAGAGACMHVGIDEASVGHGCGPIPMSNIAVGNGQWAAKPFGGGFRV